MSKTDLTKLSLIKKETFADLEKIDLYSKELDVVRGAGSKMAEAMAIANAQAMMTKVLSKAWPMLKTLVNTPLGFKTDKKDNGYSQADIINCCVVALCNGVYLSGNMFNIIAGNTYLTKEGYFYKLHNIQKSKGLSYRIVHGVAAPHNESETLWSIESVVYWSFRNNEEKSQKLNFIIKGAGFKKKYKSNQLEIDAMGNKISITTQEQIRGKADRKVMHWLYTTISGQHIPDMPEEADIDISPARENVFESAKKADDIIDEESSNNDELAVEIIPEADFALIDDDEEKTPETIKDCIEHITSTIGKSSVNPVKFNDHLIENNFLEKGKNITDLDLDVLQAIAVNIDTIIETLS